MCEMLKKKRKKKGLNPPYFHFRLNSAYRHVDIVKASVRMGKKGGLNYFEGLMGVGVTEVIELPHSSVGTRISLQVKWDIKFALKG